MVPQNAQIREAPRDLVVFLGRADRRLKLAALLAEVARPELAPDAFYQLTQPDKAVHLRQAARVVEWLGKELGDGNRDDARG